MGGELLEQYYTAITILVLRISTIDDQKKPPSSKRNAEVPISIFQTGKITL